MLVSTMMMVTWYSANRNSPTPSTTDVACRPLGKLGAYSLYGLLCGLYGVCLGAYSLSEPLAGYLISTLSTGTSPNIDQNRLYSVLGNLTPAINHTAHHPR